MRKLLGLFITATLFFSCNQTSQLPNVLSDGLHFCECVYTKGDTLLISNFGSDELNPLNNDGKGYIMMYTQGELKTLIPADGNLSAPKGLAEKNGYLYVADVNKVVVYNLNDLTMAPQIVSFPEEDVYVNHLIIVGQTLLTSVTNTGNIYALNISNPSSLSGNDLALYCNVPGANGLLEANYHLYIASYPPDNQTKEENLLYVVDNMDMPNPVPFMIVPGMYDGLALATDKESLIFSNWEAGKISKFFFIDGRIENVVTPEAFIGPAQITIYKDKIVVPDLVNSKVYFLDEN